MVRPCIIPGEGPSETVGQRPDNLVSYGLDIDDDGYTANYVSTGSTMLVYGMDPGPDCNDSDADIYPDAFEIYDGKVNDCANIGKGTEPDFLGRARVRSGFLHMSALAADGTVRSWGSNLSGRLGNRSAGVASDPALFNNPDLSPETPRVSPTPLVAETEPFVPLTNIITVESGDTFTMALKDDGTVWTWGDNYSGQLGIGHRYGYSDLARQVVNSDGAPLEGIITISMGWNHALALDRDGRVWAWGENGTGQLGLGDIEDRSSAVPVSALSAEQIISISASGGLHSTALTADGRVYVWGHGGFGQLGLGEPSCEHPYDHRYPCPYPLPVQVQVLSNIVSVENGAWFTLAIDSTGHVWGWGNSAAGQTGDGVTRSAGNYSVLTPVQSPYLENIVAVSAGRHYALAIDRDGKAYSWGRNHLGQLGDGTTTLNRIPKAVLALDGKRIKDISAGVHSVVAFDNTGVIYTWGLNDVSQLGRDTSPLHYSNVPTPIKNQPQM